MGKQEKLSSSKTKEKQIDKAKGKEKVVAKPKKKSVVQVRSSGPLEINEGGSKKKKAQVGSESESDGETQTDSSEEEQQKGVSTRRDEEEVSYGTYHKALSDCKMFQTRWPDCELLAKLGILEDVRRLLRGMGLERVLEMDYTCYPKQVLELLASFELRFNKEPRNPRHLGDVSFQANGGYHTVNIADLCEAYGFPQKMRKKLDAKEHQHRIVWEMIGKGDYTTGKTKSKRISNPAVRYAHKIIASTIFARKEAGYITRDEMALLTNGVRSVFPDEFASKGVDGYENVNLGVILAKKIFNMKGWALREDRKQSSLHIGGFLTPLLKLAATRLTNPLKTPRLRLDFDYMKRIGFVEGKDGDRILYTFVGKTHANYKVLLPNVEITKLTSLRNLSFEHDEDLDLIDAGPVEALLSMQEAEGSETRQASARMEVPLGSPRYYYSPYKGRNRSKPIEHIFGELEKANRWNKWSSRNFHNIKRTYKKQVKAFKDEILGLKRMVSYLVKKKSPPRREDGEPDFDFTMEEARRHSTSQIPSSSSSRAFDPPRASSHAHPPQRKRRLRHVPSPSPPLSDNQSIHFSSSEDEASN